MVIVSLEKYKQNTLFDYIEIEVIKMKPIYVSEYVLKCVRSLKDFNIEEFKMCVCKLVLSYKMSLC